MSKEVRNQTELHSCSNPVPAGADAEGNPARPTAAKAAAIWHFIDRETTLAHLAGDEALFNQLVDFFLEDHVPLVRDLETALESQDLRAAERAGHSLKGLAANLGATAAAQAGADVEAIARQRDIGRLAVATAALRREITCLAGALAQYQVAVRLGGDSTS